MADEVSLYVHSIPDNNIITIIGDTTSEKEILIYYERNDGSADCEFNFYILQTPSYVISLNGKQLFPVTNKSPWILEKIRLTHLYELEKAILVVSTWGEKDCFFETDTFTLAWECTERNYYDHKDFSVRYYNIDKVRSLNWSVPMGFNLSIDEPWLMGHFVESTTSHNGWYMLRGYLSNYDEPWRDVDVDLWYKPDTFETHIEVN